MTGRLCLRLLLDAGVPDSVGRSFRDVGHTVILHRDVLDDGAPDTLVCVTALKNESILVAIDGDMKRLTAPKRFGPQDDRFARLNLIKLSCGEVQAANRIAQAMSFIELEWSISQQKVARRLWLEITNSHMVTHR
ncbi:MAG: DUF5615 family PIN-like protein [Pararhizobium sp.]